MTMERDASDLVDAVRFYGFEYIFHRYPGFYDAFVVSNKDPEGRGRVQIFCPDVGQRKESPLPVWVRPACDSAGTSHGTFFPPEEGDTVRVHFENGDPSRPKFYIGGFFGRGEMPTEFAYSSAGYPEKKGFKTRTGHHLVFSDDPDNPYVRVMWHNPDPADPARTDRSKTADNTKGSFASLTIDKNGSVTLIDKNSSVISLDANQRQLQLLLHRQDDSSHSITVDEDSIKILDSEGDIVEINCKTKSITVISQTDINLVAQKVNVQSGAVYLGDEATFSNIRGEILMTYIATHTHGSAAPGSPTTPPIIPPPASALSPKVKTS